MSKAVMLAALCMLTAVGLNSTVVSAAEPAHPCVAKADPVERLACYDRAFGAPETKAQVAAAEQQAKEDFGLDRVEKQERLAPLVAESDVDQIQARITELSTNNGERLLTLDNGQRWVIVERGSRGPMRVDEMISIRKGVLGTHRVVTAAGVGLRAKRIR